MRPDTPFGPSSQPRTHRFCTLPAGAGSYLGILLVFSAMVNAGGCAVPSPRTWGPGAVSCNLQRPDSAQGPSGSLPPSLSRFWGALVSPPQLQPQAEAGHIQALETHWVRAQTSPSLSFPPVEWGVVFPAEWAVCGEVSPAPCGRGPAQSRCHSYDDPEPSMV